MDNGINYLIVPNIVGGELALPHLNFVGASRQAHGTTPSFVLSGNNGTKTVYFKTMNIFGESLVVSDTIFLH